MSNKDNSKKKKNTKKMLSEAEATALKDFENTSVNVPEDILDSDSTDADTGDSTEEVIDTNEKYIEKLQRQDGKVVTLGSNIYALVSDNGLRMVIGEENPMYCGGIKISSRLEIELGCEIEKYREALSQTRLPFVLQETFTNGNTAIYSIIRLGSGNVENSVPFTLKCVDGIVTSIALNDARKESYTKYHQLPTIWKFALSSSMLFSTKPIEMLGKLTNAVIPGFTLDTFRQLGSSSLLICGTCRKRSVKMMFKPDSKDMPMYLRSISL